MAMHEFVCERCGTVCRVHRANHQPHPRFCSRVCMRKQPEDVWLQIDRSGGPNACWPWQGLTDQDGYGRFWDGTREHRAHRFVYELVNGPIPDDILACHNCPNGDMPGCCNPTHVWPGSPAANSADMVTKGRSLSGDRNPAVTNPHRLKRGIDHPLVRDPSRAARGERNGKYTKPAATPRGERAGNARITEAIVRDIRQSAANGESGTSIAKRLGVHFATVYRVIRGETWHHVT